MRSARDPSAHTAISSNDQVVRCAAPLTAMTTLIAVLAGTLLVLAGCATPQPGPPPAALTSPLALGALADAAVAWPESRWWQRYRQDDLDRLVAASLDGHPGLRQARARARGADAVARGQDAARGVAVVASADLTDQRFSENGLVPPQLAGATRWNNNAQLGAAWEPDLFGRQRAAFDAAVGRARAAQADVQAARWLLAAQVAGGYVNLARSVEARALAQQALDQREQIVVLVRQRIGAGLDTTVDLRQAEGLVAQSQTEIEALDENMALARHALAELAGLPPSALDTLAPSIAPLPSQAVPATLPADLIGRRPDLVAQRWLVEAALRDTDMARAQFYPNINLTAFVGLSSIGLDRFVQAGSLTYGAGPALRLPLFDRGRLQAGLDARLADVDASIEGYNATLRRALREVADALTTLRSLEPQQRAQADATRAAEAAYELAVQRYRAGLGNFLVVLTAQNTVTTQRRAAVELKARRLTTEVALARALGGGFDATGDIAPPPVAAR